MTPSLKTVRVFVMNKKDTFMRYLGLNVERQTRSSLKVNHLYIENVEDGHPVTTHTHAYYDLRWGAYTLTDSHAKVCDSIGQLLLNN